MTCVRQEREHHRPLESARQELSIEMSGHTFGFCWTVQDLEVFLVQSNSPLSVKGL